MRSASFAAPVNHRRNLQLANSWSCVGPPGRLLPSVIGAHVVVLFSGGVLNLAASYTCRRISFHRFPVNLPKEAWACAAASRLLPPATPVQSECCSGAPAASADVRTRLSWTRVGKTGISPHYNANIWGREAQDEENDKGPTGRSHYNPPVSKMQPEGCAVCVRGQARARRKRGHFDGTGGRGGSGICHMEGREWQKEA